MKKLSLALAALALCGAASAAPITSNFNVTVAFTSVCQVKTNTTPPTSLAFAAYTGFAGASALTGGTFAFECSRGAGTAATFSLDGTAGTSAASTVYGLFPVRGLNYSLTVTPTTAAGSPASAVAAPTGLGTADTLNLAITGSIPQQAGGGTTAGSGGDTDPRVLTVTF